MFRLSKDPILRDELISALENQSAGALVTFEGWVRNHNQGKQVSALEYQVYETLAQSEGQKILAEAQEKFQLHDITCTHRFGFLNLGETAVWVGAVASHRDDAFRATRYVIDQIKLRLPIWKKEHYLDQEPNWVFCRDHHNHVHFRESDYYKKQDRVANQTKLKNARVLIVGLGGLGCPVATGLTSAGVGLIHLVDFDKVSISNLHRQPLFSADQVGELKTEVAKTKLSSLNPFVKISSTNARVSSDNVESLIRDADLVIDCTDNLETKYLLHDACFKTRTALISASIYQFEGQLRTFVPGESGCLRCLTSVTPDDSMLGNCNDFGVLGTAVATIGNMQANEALIFLQTETNHTVADTLYFNVKTLSQIKIKNFKNENCKVCDGNIEITQDNLEVSTSDLTQLNPLLLDVRGKDDSIFFEKMEQDRPVVLYCDRGIRSKRLVREIRSLGHSNYYSLKGGACSL